MVTASFVCFFIEAGLILAGGSHLAGQLWLPGFAVATAAFVYRFRSFWRRFGDQVLRGAAVLHAADARAAGAEHEES